MACLLLYFVGCRGYDLLTDDEIRYAEAGRRMRETGNLVIPEFNGYPRYQKPMLFYWLEALSFLLLGVSPWAARVPTALAGVGVVLMTASLGKALWGPRAGLWAGIILATSVEMFLLSRMVMTDVVLLLFIQGALTCFCLIRAVPGSPGAPQRTSRLAFLMHACLALGALTKGPVALVVPALVIGPWLAARKHLQQGLHDLKLLQGVALIVLVAGPWYWLAHVESGGEYTRQFFLDENLGRFTSVANLHRQPALFYLLLLVPMTFPWTGIVPRALLSVRKQRWRSVCFAEAAPWFFLWQIAAVLVLFSFSRTRVWTYTLPAFPALALLCGRWLSATLGQLRADDRPLRIPLRCMAGVCLVSALIMQLLPMHALPAAVQALELWAALRIWAWLLAGLSLFLVWLEARAGAGRVLAVLALGVGGWYLVGCLWLLPVFDGVWKRPVRELAALIRAHDDARGGWAAPAEVVTYNAHEIGLNFHTGVRHVRHIRSRYRWELQMLLRGNQTVFVLVSPEWLHDLAGTRFHFWGGDGRMVYGANRPPPEERARPNDATDHAPPRVLSLWRPLVENGER